MIDKDLIEKNKDKLNFKPTLNFIAEYLPYFEEGLKGVFDLPENDLSRDLANSIKFGKLEEIVKPQVSPSEIIKITSRMPESLAKLSKLSTVNYRGKVPLPVYDENGNFSGNAAEWVNYSEFPRPGDHPSRILVGLSDGANISPTPIPKTVSSNERAVRIYQAMVYMHEFFHTISYPRRTAQKREAVLLECDGERFTLQDSWKAFEELYLRDNKRLVSIYAASYEDKLNDQIRNSAPASFSIAVEEQICESFVGYMIGIVPNNHKSVNFKKAHPREYQLIDRLCRAKILRAD